jgi:cation:H+ antiporter
MTVELPSFVDLPVIANLAVFGGAAVAVWLAGVRLARIGDVLSDRTGLGKAVFGLLFLALATSLPEVSTTVTASVGGNAGLATGNIFGSIVLQTTILALADATIRRGPLTFFAPKPTLLLQGTLLIATLGLVLSTIAATELLEIGWVGVGSVVAFGGYAVSLYLLRAYHGDRHWQPVDIPDGDEGTEEARGEATAGYREQDTRALALRFGLLALVVLLAGVLLALTSSAIAEQLGIGQTFVGSTLLAASTALPEVSTTLAAVQIGAYSLAIGNIFGSNALMVGLLFVADLGFVSGPILEQLDRSAIFGAAAGIVATAIYLAGLIERRDRQVWRIGIDSAAVVAWYGVTLAVLWVLS